MKKIKFMLMSLAFLAVVGGALAFKAKFNETYCISALPDGGITCGDSRVTCPVLAVNSTTLQGGDFACTTTFDNSNCNTGPRCFEQHEIKHN